MAGQWTGSGGSAPHGPSVSRTGSLDPDTADETSGLLVRQSSCHHRTARIKKTMELPEVGSRHPSVDSLPDHLHPSDYPHQVRSRSPSPGRGHSPAPARRSPSPHRHPHHHPTPHIHHHDRFSEVVDIVKNEHDVHITGKRPNHIKGSWSASTSPARSPSPTYGRYYPHRRHPQYGTTSLEQRSRSPSPLGGRTMPSAGPPRGGTLPYPHHHHHQRDHHHHHEHHHHHHPHQHSYPVLVQRRGQGRRLPPTPSKPSTLQLRPASINFPKLNASPTHCPMPAMGPQQQPVPPPASCPLSFEQAVAMGRGGRLLPSPVPNGYKPGQQRRTRHSDSDDDDWC